MFWNWVKKKSNLNLGNGILKWPKFKELMAYLSQTILPNMHVVKWNGLVMIECRHFSS